MTISSGNSPGSRPVVADSAQPRGPALASRGGRSSLPHPLSWTVLVVGLIATAALTVSSRLSYEHTEQRLTNLQTELTASALGIAQVDFERRLGGALDLASGAADPAATFRRAIRSSMSPSGPFVTAGLQRVSNGRVQFLVVVGAKSIASLKGRAALALFERSAHTSALVTTRVLGGGQQRLGYLLSVRGPNGTLVAAAGQALPANRRVNIPPGSPDAGLNIAIYFGKTTKPSALIEASVAKTPLVGTTARATVPFGTNVLTLVGSPRGSLSGGWSEFLPWGILILGLVLSLGIAVLTERLIRRGGRAEALATENSALYREQRGISETLQRALLPKQLPAIAGVSFAARYVPGAAGVEVGGDWYSAIKVDDHRFAFVVGDVSGRGIAAATVMASLRYTIRAFASVGYRPASILEMADREIDVRSDGHFATVLVGMADTETRQVTVASAGHLDPLLVNGDTAEFVKLPTGLPLGVRHQEYKELTLSIPPGATLIGYTDGLVERRSVRIDDGMEQVRQAAIRYRGPVDSLLTHLLEEMDTPASQDDVALLGIQFD